jgi:uncharacterized membrane protein YbaN (DUF454 family)
MHPNHAEGGETPSTDPELELILARQKIRSKPLRGVLIGAGCLALALGILGIPLPVLPTTPFLLLAAWCFGRSSERLLRWLLTNRLFGRYLRSYVQNRGIPRRIKVGILVTLWITILLSAFLVVQAWWLRALLIGIAVGITVHIFRFPTTQRSEHE